MTTGGTMRRLTLALAVAVGLLAVTGPGASAADSLPKILNGHADSNALHIRLELPSLAHLENVVNQVTAGTAAPQIEIPAELKALLDKPVVIDQVISRNDASVVRADENLPDSAKSFSAAVVGEPNLLNTEVSTSCETATCEDAKDLVHTKLDLEPASGIDLGYIDIAGARSSTKGLVNTVSESGLVKVHLDLADLIGTGKPLAALGDVLDTLTSTINTSVKPYVDEALTLADSTLSKEELSSVKKFLDIVVSHIGQPCGDKRCMNPIPSLRSEDLLDLSVLAGKAEIKPKTVAGTAGILARSSSGVSDIDVLGGWATIDAATVETSAFANGVAGKGKADSNVQVLGMELGGALGIDVSEDDLAKLLDPNTLAETLSGLPVDAQDAITELIAATNLLYSVAGIDLDTFEERSSVRPDGTAAEAEAGTIALTIAPQIPKLKALQENLPTAEAVVPRLDEDDFVATGIVLKIELPKSSSVVSVGDVQACCDEFTPPGKTGVATPWLAAMVLFGGALTVRRFASAK